MYRASFIIFYYNQQMHNWYHNGIPYFPAHQTNFPPERCDLNSTCVLCAEGKYYFQINTRTSITQHLYREIVKFVSKS